MLQDPPPVVHDAETDPRQIGDVSKDTKESHKSLETARGVAELDRRIGELERLVGSASTSLDEVCSPLFSLGQSVECQLLDIELRDANTATTASHSIKHATHRACAASTPR